MPGIHVFDPVQGKFVDVGTSPAMTRFFEDEGFLGASFVRSARG
jgi:hypothetical protein